MKKFRPTGTSQSPVLSHRLFGINGIRYSSNNHNKIQLESKLTIILRDYSKLAHKRTNSGNESCGTRKSIKAESGKIDDLRLMSMP